MALLSPEDVQLVKNFKKLKYLQPYTKAELASLTQNGGSGFFCGDGDIDAYGYHAEAIPRPHHQALYGGPLLLAHSFGDFSLSFTEDIIRNMKIGMRLKETKAVFLYFHYPCQAALMFRYSLDRVFGFATEAIKFLQQDRSLDPEKIYAFFHFKWKGGDERVKQKTYRFVA